MSLDVSGTLGTLFSVKLTTHVFGAPLVRFSNRSASTHDAR